MKGLMMDEPLTLSRLFERTRRLFARKTLATRVPGGASALHLRRLRGARRAVGRRRSRGSAGQGRPRRHVRLEHPPPPGGVLRGPADGRGAAHRQLPALHPGHQLHHQPRRATRCCWSARASGRCRADPPGAHDGQAGVVIRTPGTPRSARLPGLRGAAQTWQADDGVAGFDERTPPACATPPAPPATRRAWSTPTAPSTCTRSPSQSTTSPSPSAT